MTLATQRRVMLAYLHHRVELEDWHGVWDAAVDLAKIDARIEEQRACRPSNSKRKTSSAR